MEKIVHVIAAHGCRGTFHFKDNSTFIVPINTIVINFNSYGTESSGTDSLIFMKKLYEVNKDLFNYIIDPANYLLNLDRNIRESYRHSDFFKNPLHKLYSEYNPISHLDMYIPGMTYYNGYLNLANEEGARNLHGVYRFDGPPIRTFIVPPDSKNNTKLEDQIIGISRQNSLNMNVIFVSSCRLIQLYVNDICSIMLYINPVRDFNNMSIIKYFSDFENERINESVLLKMFNIIKKDINSILSEADTSFNITYKKLELNEKHQSNLAWIQQVSDILKEKITPDKISDINEYIKLIFNDYNLFKLLWTNTYETFVLDLNPKKVTNINTYENLILFLCKYYLNPLIKGIDKLIRINNDILTNQKEFIKRHIDTLGVQPRLYNFNLYDSLYNVLTMERMYCNIKSTRIEFVEILPREIISYVYKYFKTFKRVQTDYTRLQTNETERKILFAFWCFFIVTDLLKTYQIEFNFNLLFNAFFRDITFDDYSIINPNGTSTNPIFDPYRNLLIDHQKDSQLLQKILQIFENSETTQEPPAIRQQIGMGYKQKYLKYKQKYLYRKVLNLSPP
jgi:hypothetical protein